MMNINTPQTHSPVLLNAARIVSDNAREILKLKHDPEIHVSMEVTLGDYVKLALPGVVEEFFWVEVCATAKDYWVGICRSKIGSNKDIKKGDLIRFVPENVFQLSMK